MNTLLILLIVIIVLYMYKMSCVNNTTEKYTNNSCYTRMSDSWLPVNVCSGPVLNNYANRGDWHPYYRNSVEPNGVLVANRSLDSDSVEPNMTPVVGSIDTDTVYRDSRLTYDSVNPISIYNRNVMSDVFTGSYYDLATPQKGVNSRENVVAANTQGCVNTQVSDFSMPTEYRFNNQTGVYLINTLAPDSSPEYPFGYRYNEFK